MLKEPLIDEAAEWKQRFRAPVILRTQLARAAPTRGLVVSNPSGAFQLYAWCVPTGELRQLTDRPEGEMFAITVARQPLAASSGSRFGAIPAIGR